VSLNATISARRGQLSLEVAFTVGRGQTVALLGPNGSGKSTLLRVLAGLHRLERGRVEIEGRIWEEVSSGIRLHPSRRDVALMFQSLALFPHMSALDNVAYPLRGTAGRKRVRRVALRAMEEHGIGHLATRAPRELSGGERQSVALARALVARPGLLLLDEPLAAFDVRNRAAARRHLRKVLKTFDGARLLVTHDPLEAGALADRILLLEDGRFVQEGTIAEIGSRPRSTFAASVAGVNLLSGRIVRRAELTLLRTEEGDVIVVADDLEAESAALAALHPHAISISRAQPHGSMRNVFPARVAEIDLLGSRVRVRLDSRPPLSAEITRAALDELELRPGVDVWASFKATEVDVHPA
jgi:molybdate transport system ATP-binding protein